MEPARFTLVTHATCVAVVASGRILPDDADRFAAICTSLPPCAAALQVDLSGATLLDPGAYERIARAAARWRTTRRKAVSLRFDTAGLLAADRWPMEVEIELGVPTTLPTTAAEGVPLPRRRRPAVKRRTAPWPRFR